MRILVTGASGLLGINLVLESAAQEKKLALNTHEHLVFGQVNHRSIDPAVFHLEERLHFLQADLLEPGVLERILDQAQPDWVIHCAAIAIVDECEANPDRAQKLNSEIPGKLAELVARGGARLLHISTDAVFDGLRGNYLETDEPNPLSVYARTKLAGERAVAEANPGAIIARVNLFGWSLTGKRSLSEFFFYNLQAGKSFKGFTDVFFCPLLANDLAHILLQMLAKDLHGIYHVVSQECLSKYEFALRIAKRFGFDERLITPGSIMCSDLIAARSPHLILNTKKISEALGQPMPVVDEGIQRLYELHRKGYPEMLKRSGSAR
jgi:dTDP-4-dehydrorhamnose reductase